MDGLLPMHAASFSIDQPRSQSNIYYRIDGMLLASSKFGQRRFVIDEVARGLGPVRNGELF